MIKLLSVAIIAGFLSVEPAKGQNSTVESLAVPAGAAAAPLHYPQPVGPVCWTDWFDRDNPSGTGDWEVLYYLRRENPGKICPKPTDIEVQTLSGQSLATAGEVIYKVDPTYGFVCRNVDQYDGYCKDYRVRFACPSPYCPPSYCGYGVCWTQWFDRDNPSGTGDWETLASLRKAYPYTICETPIYIEAVVVGTNAPASSTGERFHTFNPTEGFVCRNTDQWDKRCRDYKVHFGCCCGEVWRRSNDNTTTK